MKIIKDNHTKEVEKPINTHTCRWCKSVFEYDKSDVQIGDIVLSQREEYKNIEGLYCPCCELFDNLNNGY